MPAFFLGGFVIRTWMGYVDCLEQDWGGGGVTALLHQVIDPVLQFSVRVIFYPYAKLNMVLDKTCE